MKLRELITMCLANRSLKAKVKYLRKKGTKIGESTKLLCSTGAFGSEPYLIEVGERCVLSGNINLLTHDGGVNVLNHLNYFDGKRMDKIGKIKIGNNCFIGKGSKVMPGVIIGDNVIVGAGAIVTKNVPSNSIVAGIPARIICTIDEYYQKNKDNFYNTKDMGYEEKKKYLLEKLSEE